MFRGFRPRRDRSLAVVYASLESGGDSDGIELGLVCRIAYDTMQRRSRMDNNRGPHRITSTATVFEQWVPATLGQGALTVPEDGPYSYEGAAISFAWSVQARRTGKRAASAPAPVWVTS